MAGFYTKCNIGLINEEKGKFIKDQTKNVLRLKKYLNYNSMGNKAELTILTIANKNVCCNGFVIELPVRLYKNKLWRML